MPSHYTALQDQSDFALLDRILRERGQSLDEFLAAGNAGETLPLGDVGRELVGQKRAIAQREEFGQRYGVGDRVEGANLGGPSFRTKSVGGPHAQGVDALLGALRIAQLTGGDSDIPRRSPELGELTERHIARARGQTHAGRLIAAENADPRLGPARPQPPVNPDLERLRNALANSPAGPAPSGPWVGRPGKIGIGQQSKMGDIRAGSPWAMVETMVPALRDPKPYATEWPEDEERWPRVGVPSVFRPRRKERWL